MIWATDDQMRLDFFKTKEKKNSFGKGFDSH